MCGRQSRGGKRGAFFWYGDGCGRTLPNHPQPPPTARPPEPGQYGHTHLTMWLVPVPSGGPWPTPVASSGRNHRPTVPPQSPQEIEKKNSIPAAAGGETHDTHQDQVCCRQKTKTTTNSGGRQKPPETRKPPILVFDKNHQFLFSTKTTTNTKHHHHTHHAHIPPSFDRRNHQHSTEATFRPKLKTI